MSVWSLDVHIRRLSCPVFPLDDGFGAVRELFTALLGTPVDSTNSFAFLDCPWPSTAIVRSIACIICRLVIKSVTRSNPSVSCRTAYLKLITYPVQHVYACCLCTCNLKLAHDTNGIRRSWPVSGVRVKYWTPFRGSRTVRIY
jgi:hypothetical protein